MVLVAHAWVVFSAWRNRADTPGGTAELTERELRLQPVSSDSTAVFLALRWELDANEPDDDGAPAWLNAAKLEELGFDCSVPVSSPHARDHYNAAPPLIRWAVLEFDGPASKKTGRSRSTHLVLVAVGREARQLRAQYPDATRYLISRAVVRPFLKDRARRDGRPLPQPRLSARIESLEPQTIFVPPPLSRVLQGLRRRPDIRRDQGDAEPAPRYAVTLSWGARYEPWVRQVRLLSAAPETR